MNHRPLLSLFILTSAAACAEKKAVPNGEVQPIARIQLDTNRVIEVIGLRRWTVDMIQDSLRKYAPGQTLDSAGVASTLRYKLHFADAAVDTSVQVFDENEATQITVGVREPQDSARVHYALQTLDTISRVAVWKTITAKLWGGDNAHRLSVVAGRHLEGPVRDVIDSSVRAHPITSRLGYAFDTPEDSVAAHAVLDAIAKRTSDQDFATAIETVEHSTSLPDRIVAALILANFPARDSAWRALLKASVGQQQGRDASIAGHALAALSERFARPVDWTPVATTIHDVLDGTALMALPATAAAVTHTGAGPRDAKAYLAGAGEMLTAYLESANPDLSDPAHRLLVALHGSDLGTDPEPWRAWIRTL
jgi:hypothetical protein